MYPCPAITSPTTYAKPIIIVVCNVWTVCGAVMPATFLSHQRVQVRYRLFLRIITGVSKRNSRIRADPNTCEGKQRQYKQFGKYRNHLQRFLVTHVDR